MVPRSNRRFRLLAGIPVVQFGSPLFLRVEGKAEAGRVNGRGLWPAALSGGDKVSALWPRVMKPEPPTKQLPSFTKKRVLSFDPFVTVEHNLNSARGMAAHPDGEMPPLPVNDVNVLVHIRPWRFPLQADVVLPDRSRGFCGEDEEDTGTMGISGKVFFSELMLSDARGTVELPSSWHRHGSCG